MIVCHCQVVSDRDIDAAIDAGAEEICALAATCGAASGCGGCLPEVQARMAARGCHVDAEVTIEVIRARLGLVAESAAARV